MIPQPAIPTTPSEASLNDQAVLKIWSPKAICLVALFLGFPSGIALAAINWKRMGLNKKMVQYLIACTIMVIATCASSFIPDTAGSRLFFFFLNVCISIYLHLETSKEIEKAQDKKIVRASGISAFFMGMGVLLVFFLTTIAFAMVMSLIGIPIPE
jgi:uncharacterized membrane protein YfcA